MGVLNTVIVVAGAITAIAAAWAIIVKVVRGHDKLFAKISKLEEHSRENHLTCLRLTIINEEMPIGERIVAGKRYLEEGGNGEIKNYLKEKFNIYKTVDEAEHYRK